LTTRETLSEHYAETRRRLGDNRTPAQSTIPRDRISTDALTTLKEGPPKVANGITISKIPPRQSTQIVYDTARKHEISVETLTGLSRKPKIIAARQEACYLLRLAGYSYPQIARFIGNRDHTTVMHATRQYEAKHKGETK